MAYWKVYSVEVRVVGVGVVRVIVDGSLCLRHVVAKPHRFAKLSRNISAVSSQSPKRKKVRKVGFDTCNYKMAKSEEKSSKKRRREQKDKDEVAEPAVKQPKTKKSKKSKDDSPAPFLAADSATFDPSISSLFAQKVGLTSVAQTFND